MTHSSKWQFWVDRGGTFTDIVARDPQGMLSTRKLLSINPERYEDAAIAGIKATLGIALNERIPEGLIDEVRIGTTIATNALLERKGERTVLVVNRGFADLLQIGNQTRPKLFDLNVVRAAMLYDAVFEIEGRVDVEGVELEAIDEASLEASFKAAFDRGIRACAIVLMHSWKFPQHEQRVADLARKVGFTQVSVSHEISHSVRIIPRGNTSVVDAYLSPLLRAYVKQVSAELSGVRLYFMQSSGGLAAASHFRGKDAVLSGPAGGVVGAARTAEMAGFSQIIGFDMGGTSTDVALYAGEFERTYDAELAGVQMRMPMMSINTVAAGGGSILEFDGSRFRVGPHSAGATPGPASYRKGGPLTITDANICVGKIQPQHFPSIFGPLGDQPLDGEVVREKFMAMADSVASATGTRRDPRDIAEGFLRVAVTNMANAIKQVSVQKGHNPSEFVLQSFGGAGAQHACLVAEELNMDTILIHPFAGVLSAYGIGLAEQTLLREKAIESDFNEASLSHLNKVADDLESEARQVLGSMAEHGETRMQIRVTRSLHLRFAGTDTSMATAIGSFAEMLAAVRAEHLRRFGFSAEGKSLVVSSVSIEAVVQAEPMRESRLSDEGRALKAIDSVSMWTYGKPHQVPVYERDQLPIDMEVAGPALIREATTMTVVEPGWKARLGRTGNLTMHRDVSVKREQRGDHAKPDPVLLEIFNRLFMSVAEQSGAVLQNTARSVNIRERLDFSCAVFDGSGNLVANAPHVPVHLGAMGVSVRTVLRERAGTLKPGDCIALNNPANGGTHLPDVTVITPVFADDGKTILFFVGNRGHHADIGGSAPGSMPSDSTTLGEEGIVIDDFLLVDGGHFRETEFRALLASGPYPARSPDMNVADIGAQVAGNQRAVQELHRVIAQYGWPLVSAYMRHVRDNAAENVRVALGRLRDGSFSYLMDDGGYLRVSVRIDQEKRTATIDFTGTDPQRADNFNAPLAVTRAVVLYVFRCLVGDDIPLNEGCLEPLEIIIPPGTFLSPSNDAAVVAGNTEVSQCICNALFGALGALACSQGTMNNFLFGDATRQYYETICGGTGAGPGFNGASAVQAHMTNTRMTDPEVLEMRYPVILETFAIRRNSGGGGQWHGGDGAIRKIRFLEPMTATLVSSHREVAPFGLNGGGAALPGRQWVERAGGTLELRSGRDRIELNAGDSFVIETPGGGGYNMPTPEASADQSKLDRQRAVDIA